MHWKRRNRHEQELERELRSHLDAEAEEQRERGLPDKEAEFAARRAFGNATLVREETRAVWSWTAVERFAQDLRYALRAARRNPGFAAIAVGTLAIGIGVNTAVFSVVNTVLLRKLPYAAPDRLVTLHEKFPRIGGSMLGTSPGEFLDYRDRTRAFSSLAGYEDADFDLTGGPEPVRVQAERVTYTLFSTLGAGPFAGRTFNAAEDRPGADRVAILSYDFWQRSFGGRADRVGSIIRLNEQPYTVVGIMPEGFEFPFTAASVGEPPALWVPMAFTPARLENRVAEFPVHIVARLRPGVSPAQAGMDVARVAAEFSREHADTYSGNLVLQTNVTALGSAEASRARPVLLALSGAVVFVLLIACANVMNLLIARAAARQREMALRCALGAGRRRLVLQLLSEGLLLAGAGAALGWALAVVLLRMTVSLWPAFVAGLPRVRIDPAALAFTVAISVLTGLACALAPLFAWASPEIGETLKQAGRQGGSQAGNRIRAGLVVFEAASAVTLLVGAGLLVHSLVAVLHVPMGFSPEGVLIARTELNRQRYGSNDRRRETERRMTERISALPGVTAVGLATHIPLADERQIGFILEGEDYHAARWADNSLVDGGYFAAMRIPIVRGRAFTAQDTPQSPLAAIVNESLERRLWPNGNAIGKVILWGGRRLVVVGVAGDVHVKALDAAVNPTIYTSVYQVESAATTSAVFVVRTRRIDPASLGAGVRQAIWSADRGVPVFDMRTMDQIVARSLTSRRFAVAVLSLFAGLALALAMIGLYGVLSYSVTQRTSELGVRIALGATPGELLRLVLGNALRLTGTGVLAGAILGAAAARGISTLLFGVRQFDPAAFGFAAGSLMVVAAAAAYLPARRAAHVDPIVALRQE